MHSVIAGEIGRKTVRSANADLERQIGREDRQGTRHPGAERPSAPRP
jgi:hypothetical protein